MLLDSSRRRCAFRDWVRLPRRDCRSPGISLPAGRCHSRRPLWCVLDAGHRLAVALAPRLANSGDGTLYSRPPDRRNALWDREPLQPWVYLNSVSYTHLRAHETDSYLVCRLLLEK